MNDELKVIISAEISKLKKGVDDAKKEIKSFKEQVKDASKNVDSKFKAAGEKIGTTIKKGVKVAVTSMAAMGTAVAGVVTACTKSYAEFEQLAGGVKKLFDTSSDEVMNYAKNAYKNAGLSANEYMTQVTSFSASLISSLGGDTAEAAKMANMAIEDMADNVNVFGSNMEDVQNAYQGFAKQNYTMLDNLKLGYGGTKEEMQRLIDDANMAKEAIGEVGDLTIDSYADVIEAIHLVQDGMKITGTTAAEAERTISGSIAMTKAAWENLMVGLADSNANIPQLVSNVISSGTKVLKNIMPVAKQVLESIPAAISEISPEAGAAMQALVDFAADAWPVLKAAVQEALDVISATFSFISEHTGALAAVAAAIGVVVAAIGLYNAVAAVKAAMAAAEVASVWALVAAYAAQAAAMIVAIAPYILIVAAIAAVIAIIVICVKHWEQIKNACANAWNSIKEKTSEAVGKVVDKFNEMKDKASEKISAMKEKVSEKFNDMKEVMGNVMQAAKDTVSEKLNNMKQAYEANGGGMKGAVAAAMEGIKGYYTAGYTFIDNLTGGKLSSIVSTISSKMNAAKSAVSGVLEGIKAKFNSILSSAANIVKSGIDKIKSFFNFSWSLPKLKMPHFSVSGKFSLRPPSAPKFSISWYQYGGVFDKKTLFPYGNGSIGGLGENGAEAVVPLEKNTQWLDKIADRLASKQGSTPIVLQVDGKTFAEITVDTLNDLTRQTGSLPLRLV